VALAALPIALLRADTIAPNANTVLASMPSNIAFAVSTNLGDAPFWNNVSYDGSQMNVGYFLTGSGAFNGGPVYLPDATGQYLAATGSGGLGQPASFNFVRGALSMNVSILYENSSQNGGPNGTSIGIYDVNNPSNQTILYSAGTVPANVGGAGLGVSTPYANYGFFATTCDSGPQCYTFFSDTSLNPTVGSVEGGSNAMHQHFALFNLASSPGVYYLGYEDSFGAAGFSGLTGFERIGEYNDILIRITTAASNPEPGTFGVLGFGLAALAYARRRRGRAQ
jgi:hypothetical protein